MRRRGLLALGASAVLAACGVKAPPRPPEPTPAVAGPAAPAPPPKPAGTVP